MLSFQYLQKDIVLIFLVKLYFSQSFGVFLDLICRLGSIKSILYIFFNNRKKINQAHLEQLYSFPNIRLLFICCQRITIFNQGN